MNAADGSLPRLAILPASCALPERAARAVLAVAGARRPDLSAFTILVPTPALIRPLAQALVRENGSALLGPSILTLAGFAQERSGLREGPMPALDCRLLLAKAIADHPQLFPGQDAWTLAEALYALIEELSADEQALAYDAPAFAARIARAYGAEHPLLSREAQTVHLLWRAFVEQTGARSPALWLARALQAAFRALDPDDQTFMIGFDQIPAAQAGTLRDALQRDNVHCWLHGRRAGRDGAALDALCRRLGIEPVRVDAGVGDAADAVDALFGASAQPLRTRVTGKIAPAIQVCEARGPEHEARIVDLAVRQALLEGCERITVIAQDRRIARRLRALLERAGVPLRDEIGWLLSTSHAAASLVFWLDAREQDFQFRPLLDLLKSSLFDPAGRWSADVERLEARVYRSRETRGLVAARAAGLDELATHLESAGRELAPANRARPAALWCRQLIASLTQLGLWQNWREDVAGQRLIEEIESLQASVERQGTALDWPGFRRLLERLLEQAMFSPAQTLSPVRLLTLEQARGLSCDALIISGTTAANFPGAPAITPVFNQTVRAELGLSHWREHHALALARFATVLRAAPRVTLCHGPDRAGEPATPSPWIDVLLAAWPALADTALAALAASPAIEIAEPSERPPRAEAPRPAAVAELLPDSLSASAHQALIDCPYKFHAISCLQLKALAEPDELPSRRDYGERLHAILQAFHEARPGMPAPFGEPVTLHNRERALQRLGEIAQAVLSRDLRARFFARAWLAEIRDALPELVDWLIARGPEWRVGVEVAQERALAPGWAIHGRVDRLETGPDGAQRIVDYKSGEAPSQEQAASGEHVQAAHYALLMPESRSFEFLQVKRERGKSPVRPLKIEGETLAVARAGTQERLLALTASLDAGAALPAQGDEASCGYCDYAGLCRKGSWLERGA